MYVLNFVAVDFLKPGEVNTVNGIRIPEVLFEKSAFIDSVKQLDSDLQ